jgi:hypothetical protein
MVHQVSEGEVMSEKLTLGYTCPVESCETRVILEEALLKLVIHDVCADRRTKRPDHCLELQLAIEVLKDHCGYTDNMYLLEE